MPNYLKEIKYETIDGNEIIAWDTCLIIGSRTIVGHVSTVNSLDKFSDEDMRIQFKLALQLVGASEDALSEFLFIYDVKFDSVSPNSVTDLGCLLVRKRDVSAITVGSYGVFSGNFTREEVETLEVQLKEIGEKNRRIMASMNLSRD